MKTIFIALVCVASLIALGPLTSLGDDETSNPPWVPSFEPMPDLGATRKSGLRESILQFKLISIQSNGTLFQNSNMGVFYCCGGPEIAALLDKPTVK